MRDICLGLRPDQLSHDKNLELTVLFICLFIYLLLGCLKDSNAAENSVDSDIIYALIYLPASSCMITYRWRGVTRDRDKKAHSDLNYV